MPKLASVELFILALLHVLRVEIDELRENHHDGLQVAYVHEVFLTLDERISEAALIARPRDEDPGKLQVAQCDSIAGQSVLELGVPELELLELVTCPLC